MKLTLELRGNAGLQWVLERLSPLSPFGRTAARDLPWYGPGDEAALEEELDNVALSMELWNAGNTRPQEGPACGCGGTELDPADLKDAASIGIIGAADGPTSILVSQTLGSNYIGAIAVAAYSYMALVPIIQPFAIKLVTTKKERAMRMPYKPQGVTRRMRILFPIVVSVIAGLVAPSSVALVGFLMFGNLIRECGVLESLSKTAQNDLANLITLLLGITIAASMKADQFVQPATIMIMCLGLVAFVLDSMVGVIFVKILNIFTPHNKINPMVGAAGISAFPMSSRVIEKLGQEADPQNHLLMHAAAANVSGQIASVVAGGVVLQFFANMG